MNQARRANVSLTLSWRLTTVLLILGLAGAGALPGAAIAQSLLDGTTQVVNNGPGDQIDPHVDCSLASYTSEVASLPQIRYFNFTTNTDVAIPIAGQSFLSDVQGTRVVFTNVTGAGSQIVVFDTATNNPTTIPGGNQRTNASIGSTLVAFEDRSFSANANESEIVAYDLATGVTTRITLDALMDKDPMVTPAGDAIVFTKCLTTGLSCDIYVARQTAPGVFVTVPITGPAGEESNPDTNGTIAVYTSIRNGQTNVFYQPIAGGTETMLDIAGEQRNPSVSGHLIAFESMTPAEDNFDIFVYDTNTNTLYRVTQTPVDETLNDITVCGETARIVYSAPGAGGDFDVFAFTFRPPAASVPFRSFYAAVAFDRDAGANDDELRVSGVFALGSGSNGINPLAEDVSLQVGPFSATIPAESFARDRFGLWRFDGTIEAHHVQVVITPLGRGRYAFAAEAEGLELTGQPAPVTVEVRIGNDSGTITVTPLIH